MGASIIAVLDTFSVNRFPSVMYIPSRIHTAAVDFATYPLAQIQALNFRKFFYEITVDPKVPRDGPIFWLGLEARDPLAPAMPIFPPKLNFSQKNGQIMISHH